MADYILDPEAHAPGYRVTSSKTAPSFIVDCPCGWAWMWGWVPKSRSSMARATLAIKGHNDDVVTGEWARRQLAEAMDREGLR